TWRPPAHLPPREGARVRRRLPPATRGTRAALEAVEDRNCSRGGATTALRRHDPRSATTGVELVGQAEPLSGRARTVGESRGRACRAGRPLIRRGQELAPRASQG